MLPQHRRKLLPHRRGAEAPARRHGRAPLKFQLCICFVLFSGDGLFLSHSSRHRASGGEEPDLPAVKTKVRVTSLTASIMV
jgi:hypothetical protein